MKNLSLIISGVLAVAVAVLFYLQFKSCDSCKKPKVVASAQGGQLIAYVNIDSLEANYEFFKEKKAALEKTQQNAEATIQRDAETFQREVYDFQQRAQTMTQAEGEATQERLMSKKDALERKQQQLSESLLAEQTNFNKELNAKLDSFLAEYNADKNYAYILSYAKGGSILYKDSAYDITVDVVKGMNEQYKKK